MTVLLRSLVVWLVLLAVPYQGYASATMMLCAAPQRTMTMPVGAHDHAAMMAAQAHESLTQEGHAHSGSAKSSHGVAKCGGSACCAAAAPVFAQTASVPVMPELSAAVSSYTAFLPSVHLDHPERPPQGLHA